MKTLKQHYMKFLKSKNCNFQRCNSSLFNVIQKYFDSRLFGNILKVILSQVCIIHVLRSTRKMLFIAFANSNITILVREIVKEV